MCASDLIIEAHFLLAKLMVLQHSPVPHTISGKDLPFVPTQNALNIPIA